MDKNDKFYLLLGEFLSKVNSLEFFVNIMLETVIGNYSNKIPKKNTEEIIDFTQEQSLSKRINHLCLFLVMTKPKETELIVSDLIGFSKMYNKEIRNYRDFIAHNPLISGEKNSKIVSSRRYKGKLNSLNIDELNALNDKTIESVKEINQISILIFNLYPLDVVRSLE